ncbi:YitT family protein [Prevotella sp.]|uniref:YitT family protein n=1 Tax=Prevotella sp. TaxID=59823 RepID=UPI003FD79DC2
MNKSFSLSRLKVDHQQVKDIFMLFIGVLCYAVGYTAFILPEKVVMGGVSGLSALIFYATAFPPGYSIWLLNFLMLGIAIKTLSRKFIYRTFIGVTMLAVVVAVLQPFFAAHPVITAGEDKFMHVLIGGLMGGIGLGVIYSHNGSTGGTDILIAILNKYFRMSFGRAMQFIDFTIIASSYLLFHSVELIVYGAVFTLVASYMCDYIVNGARQTVQFIIISKHYKEIADVINNSVHRGVTLVEGKGWYSQKEVDILIVMARRYESQDIFRCIKKIDPDALVSQTNCQGIFGEGFDTFK